MINHPSLDLRVGDAERARAESLLQDAYSAGRLSHLEFDQRIGMVMTAQTRRDLNASVANLPAPIRTPQTVAPRHPQATGFGAAAHFSGLLTWIFGPLFLYAAATPGTPARREAAKAFNFQLVAGIACLVTAIVGGVLLPEAAMGIIMPLGWVGWLVLTIMGGARAASGQPWLNPVTSVIRLQVLDPKR